MDNENRSGQSGNDSWVDDILSYPETGEEIGPDEQAIQSANLSHPEDAELDQIMQEALSGAWDTPPEDPQPADTPSEAEMFHDDEYRDAFGEGEELAEVFSDKPMKKKKNETSTEKKEPVRKGRPKRKKGYGLLGIPHLLATAVWAAIIIVIGVSLGRMVWVSAADVLAFGREEQIVTITVTDRDAEDMDALAEKLCDAGLIRYPGLFKLYAGIAIDEGEISPGTYNLSTLYDYHALANNLHSNSASREEVELMFPEGATCADIFTKLEENGVCTVAELEEAASSGDLGEYWFLDGVERGSKYCLEGFLFPDTYKFYTDDDPERVLKKFLSNFDNRFSSSNLQEKLETLNAQLGEDHAMTLYEIVIVASMIEKETANTLEGYTVSSVIYNRLTRWELPYLNIDATLIYALGGNVDPETGKVMPLTAAQLEMDHPYNTYKYMGLTPGPIANPGLGSLNAALEPEDTDYYYYALDPESGVHRFFSDDDDFYDFLDTVNYG